MKILLDTNIVIHREAATVVNEDIGVLFRWLDNLRHNKCIHPVTAEELQKHKDLKVRKSFKIKLTNYNVLKTIAPGSKTGSAGKPMKPSTSVTLRASRLPCFT